MDERYLQMANAPQDAIKPINFGKLKGKSDINPQWRYEALTETFGLCGLGWKFEFVNSFQSPVPATGELLLFVQINLYIKEGENWSAPIPGFGGDYILIKDKNGLHGNDEALKMAITDALGTAAKMVGVAANVYRGQNNTKYARYNDNYADSPKPKQNTAPPKQETKMPAAPNAKVAEGMARNQALNSLLHASQNDGFSNEVVGEAIKWRFGGRKGTQLSLQEAQLMLDNYPQIIRDMLKAKGQSAA